MAKKTATVKYKDTWATVAKRYGVNASDLARKNASLNKLVAGQVITIPQPEKPSPDPTGGRKPRQVRPGTGQGQTSMWSPTGTGGNANNQQYDAWMKPPDTGFFFNGKKWVTTQGTLKRGPENQPGVTPLPFGGNPPPNWAANQQFSLGPEKKLYYYWDSHDWTWKVGRGGKKGGGGGGGGGGEEEGAGASEVKPPSREGGGYPASAGGYTYGSAEQSQPNYNYFAGVGQQNYSRYGNSTVSPTGRVLSPNYVGLINWRFPG